MMICLPADEEYEDHGDDDADDDADTWWSRVTKDCRPMSNTGTTAKRCYDDADDDADSWWCWVRNDVMICLPADGLYEDHGDDDADDDADSSWCWQLMMVTADDAD